MLGVLVDSFNLINPFNSFNPFAIRHSDRFFVNRSLRPCHQKSNIMWAMGYICSVCGEEHTDLPHIGSAAPFQWSDEFAKDPDSLLTDDLCIIKGRDHFVRGVIEIPVHDYEHEFGWGVWVSHKKENFEIYRANFDTPDIGPFFGWLCTKIDYYPEPTVELKTMAYYRGEGLRPLIIVEPSAHPLSRQQQEGISLAEAWKIVHHYQDKV